MRKRAIRTRTIELILLFIIVPSLLLLVRHDKWWYMLSNLVIFFIIFTATIFSLGILLKYHPIKFSFQKAKKEIINYGKSWYFLCLKLIFGMIVTGIIMYFYKPNDIFSTIINNPFQWLGISIFYFFFSVYPQEFIYRVFFFLSIRNNF